MAATTLQALTELPTVTLDFEEFVQQELGLSLALEKAPLCRFFMRGHCPQGQACPNRHQQRTRTVVCKHWLRGLCKKGDTCEFLHEYNMKRMPECWFYTKYGECSNAECLYLHIDADSRRRECPWFARGFCKHGPQCRSKHVKKPICALYVTGFCPYGPDCSNGHPKFEISALLGDGTEDTPMPMSNGRLDHIVCFKCGQRGHFANQCPTSFAARMAAGGVGGMARSGGGQFQRGPP
ncbi:RNA-binding component of cleavage and polyadenylation factor [Sorochytrium milnesiophthora]